MPPTLKTQNVVSKNCSGTPRPNHKHQHISNSKLTGGYPKRLSGCRAEKQNVTIFANVHVQLVSASTPGPLQYYFDGGIPNRLYKSCSVETLLFVEGLPERECFAPCGSPTQDMHLRPAVHRQPGYRRVDPWSARKQLAARQTSNATTARRKPHQRRSQRQEQQRRNAGARDRSTLPMINS